MALPDGYEPKNRRERILDQMPVGRWLATRDIRRRSPWLTSGVSAEMHVLANDGLVLEETTDSGDYRWFKEA